MAQLQEHCAAQDTLLKAVTERWKQEADHSLIERATLTDQLQQASECFASAVNQAEEWQAKLMESKDDEVKASEQKQQEVDTLTALLKNAVCEAEEWCRESSIADRETERQRERADAAIQELDLASKTAESAVGEAELWKEQAEDADSMRSALNHKAAALCRDAVNEAEQASV